MHSDPTVYIIASALVGATIGFFGCAIVASRAIRRANIKGWQEGCRCRQREENPFHVIR
jgi:hypothetical protein